MEDDTSQTPAGGQRPPGRRPKPPLTIDLPATEVGPAPMEAASSADREAAPPVPPTGPEPPRPAVPPLPPTPPRPPSASRPSESPRSSGSAVIAAGLLGGLVALVIVIIVAAIGLLPSSGGPTVEAATAAAKAATDAVTALEQRIAVLEGQSARIDGLAGKVQALETSVAARVSASAAEGPNPAPALAALGERVGRLEVGAASSPAISPDFAARVAAIEASLKALSEKVTILAARPATVVESERAARAVAIGTIRQAAEKGGPFVADLAMLTALGADEADLASLRPLAEKGAPSRAELAKEFPDIADAILVAAAPVDPNAGLLDRIAGLARGLVTVRPTAPIAGTTPEAIVSRMQAAVERGDLSAALAEREGLPAAAKTASAAWAGAAENRVAIDDLVGKLTRSAQPAGGG